MEVSPEAQGVDLLFKKLGHNIAEIRTRALESIWSKLEHGLIHDADLVQEKQLMIRLLEWFNFNPSPKQDLVLQLLARLVKHSSACDLLVSVGAVTFLSQLRTDADSDFRPQIDVIIDKLLHVTDRDLLQARTLPRRCVYGKSNYETANEKSIKIVEQPTYGYFTSAAENDMDETASTMTPPFPKTPDTRINLPTTSDPDCMRFAGFPWHSLTGTDRHVLASTGASLCSPSTHLVRNACAFLLDVIFRDFPPEIFLQRPSIVQTLLTLISSRPGGQLMTGALDCLQSLAIGVLARLHYFQDPALYCPRQGLPFHSDSRSGTRLSSVDSFSPSEIGSREGGDGALRFERSVGDGRDDHSSSSASSTRASIQGLGRQQTTASQSHLPFNPGFSSLTWNSSDIDDETESNIPALKRSQITAPQFGLAALVAALPSTKTDSPRLALSLLQACSPLVNLVCRTIKADKLWTDRSAAAQSLQTQARQLFEIAGLSALYHYNMGDAVVTGRDDVACSDWVHKLWTGSEAQNHRLVFNGIVALMMKLLKGVLPLETASLEVKSSLGRALYVIACDECLRLSSPEHSDLALSYLEHCSPERWDAVRRTRKVVDSFSHSHAFLKEYQNTSGDVISVEMMEMAESGLDALPYRCDVPFIRMVVQSISRVFLEIPGNSEETNQLQSSSKRVLLQLLAHPLVKVRRSAYEQCLEIVRGAVNVAAAAENPGHTTSHACRFLLDSEVLYELCCHGLGDSSRLVSHPAQEMIALLLQGRLLVAESVWKDFCQAVKPILPALQAYTGETEVLRSAISQFISPNELVNTAGSDVELDSAGGSDDTECIRACLRALMLKHRASRGASAARLQQLVTGSDSLARISGLTDLLVVDTPLSLVPRDEAECFRIRRSIFQEEAVLRMLSVFRSSDTEQSVRIGALRQLATMLDDPALHSSFLQSGGLDSIVEKLKELAARDVQVLTEDGKTAVAACILTLKLLLRRDATSRGHLSRDRSLLLVLLRASALCRLSVAALADVVVVIGLLVFHECLREYARSDFGAKSGSDGTETVELSLPSAIVARYQIPFLCPTHHAVSVHRQLVCPPSPTCDPLTAGPPASALRIGWHLARCDDDVVKLLRESRTKDEGKRAPSDEIVDLRLTEADRISLEFCNPISAASSLLLLVSSSRSHSSASHAFTLFRLAAMTSHASLPLVRALLTAEGQIWKDAFVKFLQVLPTCYEDELLLANLTSLLDQILAIVESQTTDELDGFAVTLLDWLLQKCLLTSTSKTQQFLENVGSPLLRALESSEPQPEPAATPGSAAPGASDHRMSSVTVRRQLCKVILSLLSRMSRMILRAPQIENETIARFHRELRTVLLVRLRLADAPQFYDLPSMEVTLECLVHVSATLIGQGRHASLEATDRVLMQQLLGTLLEIVSAFHIGSGASSLSYMGKGVSRCATQCILHLAREMAKFGITDWSNLLEYAVPSQAPDRHHAVTEAPGLEWLIPLWSARDPRTRFAGLAIATAVSTTRKGCLALANGFQRYPGGLWNTALCVFLDHSECSLVREQSCLLLCNMLSHPFQEPPESPSSEMVWQGPVVQDEATGSTLVGLPALAALLHHAHVSDHVMLLLSHYHPDHVVRSPGTSSSGAQRNARQEGGVSMDSVAGSNTAESVRSSATPLTQPSMSNVFQSLSSANKDTFVSNVTRQVNSSATAEHRQPAQVGVASANNFPSLPDEWRALCTPSLVGAVCKLLSNLVTRIPDETVNALVQKDTIFCLNSLLEVGRIESIFAKLMISDDREDGEDLPSSFCSLDAARRNRRVMQARSLLLMHESASRLFQAASLADPASIAPLLASSEESFTKNILGVLSLEEIDESWHEIITSVNKAALDFLCALLHLNMKRPLSNAIIRQWHVIYGAAKRIFAAQSRSTLDVTMFRTLALLFKSENLTRSSMSEADVSLAWVIEKKKGNSCDASDICLSLINVFETTIAKPSSVIPGDVNDRLTSCSLALQNLFACSCDAQEAAMEAGFLERCVEEAKRLHLKMSLRFTTSSSTSSSAAKGAQLLANDPKSFSVQECDSFTQPILLITSLLNNLLHGRVDSKKHAASAGLGQVLCHLWSWTPAFSTLVIPLLRLIATYTAGCEQASTSLSTGGQQSVASSLVKSCRDIHSSVLSRSKLATPLLHLTFDVIVNCASSQECRALVWKLNILELFASSADRGQHPKRSKQQTLLLEQWLRIMLALSFYADGQLNILKIRDIFEILIELHSSGTHPRLVLLTIRNLCFHAPSKNRISSHKSLVRLLLNGLQLEQGEANLIAASALWSLLCNSQKAKVHLKGAGLAKNVQNVIARLTLEENNNVGDPSEFKACLTNVLQIMQA